MTTAVSIQRPKDAVVCPRCVELIPLLIDVSPFRKSGDVHSQWWDGTYGKVRIIRGLTPDSCELCRILSLEFSALSGFDAVNTSIHLSYRSLGRYNELECNTLVFNACSQELALAPVLPTVTTQDGIGITAFTGRLITPLLMPFLAKSWLKGCVELHKSCNPAYSLPQLSFVLRMIDVEQGCIVQIPPKTEYVALSYVWGDVKQVLLNRKTRGLLETPGSITTEGLKRPSDLSSELQDELEGRRLPGTIRDAIRLCRDHLQIRHLWVDSLCIMQDDDEQTATGAWTNADKLTQIPQMHIIYGASTLTVVAACGQTSNAGLAGVHASSSRNHQVKGRIGDQIFVSIMRDPLESLWTSQWTGRAWTFQEFLLSRRRLIFLPTQVVFQCSRLAWCEDHSLEFVDDPSEVAAWTKSFRLSPLQLPDLSAKHIVDRLPMAAINDHYCMWLRNYLKRRLTVADDILFAFEGVLSVSGVALGAFHHGLPRDFFCESLHWLVATNSGSIGMPTSPFRGLTTRRKGFPSWSWAGWMWDVGANEEFSTNYQAKSPTNWRRVAIWELTKKNQDERPVTGVLLSTPDVSAWNRLEFFSPDAFDIQEYDIDKQLDQLLGKQTLSIDLAHCIGVKTLTATVYPDPASPTSAGSHGQVKVYVKPVFDKDHFFAGFDFPSSWSDRLLQPMQILITGSYFYGPDPRWPTVTDELNPMFDLMVVHQVEHGIFERLTVFVTRFSYVKKLEWNPIFAVIQ